MNKAIVTISSILLFISLITCIITLFVLLIEVYKNSKGEE